MRGARLIVIAAAVVIVLAGLRAAQAFVVPLLMAVFLTVLCAPPLRALRRWGLPEWLAVALVVTGARLCYRLKRPWPDASSPAIRSWRQTRDDHRRLPVRCDSLPDRG